MTPQSKATLEAGMPKELEIEHGDCPETDRECNGSGWRVSRDISETGLGPCKNPIHKLLDHIEEVRDYALALKEENDTQAAELAEVKAQLAKERKGAWIEGCVTGLCRSPGYMHKYKAEIEAAEVWKQWKEKS